MKVIAIILFVMQALSIFGGISSGDFFNVFSYGFSYMLGYFLPAIIGVILLVIHNKKKNK